MAVGIDPERQQAIERAHKALLLLKAEREREDLLTETQREACCAIVAERCMDSFFFFAKHVLDMDLLTEQTHQRWCADLQSAIYAGKKRFMRLKPRGSYKCVRRNTPLLPFGIDDNRNIIPAILMNQKDFFEDGIEVELKSGRKHVCTKDHLFRTMYNWELPSIGLRIAVARKIPSPYIAIDEGEEYLMGVLVGDACLRKSTPRLSCPDEEIINKLRNYGFDLKIIGNQKIEYYVRGFIHKVRDCGLEGTNSWTKFIPKKYEGSPHFLRGLFDTDAFVDKRHNSPRIIYTTVSEKLADDVLRNLLYFGIVARKKYYEYDETEKSPKIKCYQVSIYGEDLIKYRDNIGFIQKMKKERLEFHCNRELGLNNNVDTIPAEWMVNLKYGEMHKLRYDGGISVSKRYSCSPKKLLKAGEFLANEEIIKLATEDIFWDEIVSIKDVGKVEFSAIGSDIENYISDDGVIHHNTTVYGIAFVLWLWACWSPFIRIFYTSANALLLQEVYDKINQYVGTEKNDTLFSSIFGIVKDKDAKNTSDVINIKGRSGKGFSLVFRTAGGNTTGIHPNVIIVDDPVGEPDRESEAIRNQKINWFDTLTPLLVPIKLNNVIFESIYYIGTVWHLKDLTSHIQAMNKKLPQERKWDIEIESILTPDGKPAYPEFFPMEKILEVKSSISEVFFSTQYMNKALSEALQTFNLKRLHFIRPDQFAQIFPLGELLCVFDPSLGKSQSDFPAVWWTSKYEDTITFFDAIDKKVEISLLVHQIAAKNKEYGCRTMLFEDNNAILVRESLENAHRRIGHKINIESIHHSSGSGSKETRIISCQPELYSGAVQFMSDYEERYPEAMNQIVFYGAYGNDDFPDSMEMAISYFREKHFKFVRYESCL